MEQTSHSCANPLKTLEIYGACTEFSDLFFKMSGQELHCIFFNDEVTAGHVLSPLKKQKCTLFFVCFEDSVLNLFLFFGFCVEYISKFSYLFLKVKSMHYYFANILQCRNLSL